MKSLIASLAAFASTAALAHDSTVPHVHPHSVSILPELGALILAALLVGATVVLVHRRRKIK